MHEKVEQRTEPGESKRRKEIDQLVFSSEVSSSQ